MHRHVNLFNVRVSVIFVSFECFSHVQHFTGAVYSSMNDRVLETNYYILLMTSSLYPSHDDENVIITSDIQLR